MDTLERKERKKERKKIISRMKYCNTCPSSI